MSPNTILSETKFFHSFLTLLKSFPFRANRKEMTIVKSTIVLSALSVYFRLISTLTAGGMIGQWQKLLNPLFTIYHNNMLWRGLICMIKRLEKPLSNTFKQALKDQSSTERQYDTQPSSINHKPHQFKSSAPYPFGVFGVKDQSRFYIDSNVQ